MTMSHRFNIIRGLLRGLPTTQPNAPNGDATLEEAPLKDALRGEPPLAEAIAATAVKTTPGQNPVVIFVSLIFWTWLWGVPGALLSVPILVSIKVVCDRVPVLSSVSELLTRSAKPDH